MAIKFPASGTASYLSAGNVSLPAGDWAIFGGLSGGLFTGSQVAQCFLSIGDASDTILGGASHISVGTSNPSGASAYHVLQLGVTGQDSAGLNIGTRPIPDYMDLTTTRNCLTGLRIYNSGNTFFCLQKSGTEIQLWQAFAGQAAVCIHKAVGMGAWAGITAKPLIIGALNRASKYGGVTVGSAMQRIGKVAKALTAAQMEAIFSGVDPVTLLSMNAPDGDLYWALDNTAALNAAETYDDAIQSQTATVTGGSWQTPAQIIPLTQTDSDVRVLYRQIYHLKESPGAIKLDGTYRATGTSIQVQARVLNSGTQAVITDWTTMQTVASGSGTWTGSMPGMTRQVLDLELQLRMVIDSVNQTAVTGIAVFQCGIVVNLMGQSLAEYIRTASAFQSTVPAHLYSFVPSTAVPTTNNYLTSAQKDYRHGTAQMFQFLVGYGEVKLATVLNTGASCRVLVACDAQAGSNIGHWNGDSNLLKSRAIETMTRCGQGIIIWEQGQSDQAAGYDVHLETLYQSLVTALGVDNFEFGISPLALTTDHNSSAGAIYTVRREQALWARAKIAAGVTNVFLADNNTNDIHLSDNTHEVGDITGAGRMVERWAQTILKRIGVATNSGEGPVFTGITWDGATTITVSLAQNGGTGLQTPNVAAITGFTVSGDGGETYAAPSDAQIIDATTIELTLSGTPDESPLVRYQYGGPGATATDGQSTATRRTNAGIDNPVYDNRTPGLNTALGFPVGFTTENLAVAEETGVAVSGSGVALGVLSRLGSFGLKTDGTLVKMI